MVSPRVWLLFWANPRKEEVRNTAGGRNPAPPKEPWILMIPLINTNNKWFPMVQSGSMSGRAGLVPWIGGVVVEGLVSHVPSSYQAGHQSNPKAYLKKRRLDVCTSTALGGEGGGKQPLGFQGPFEKPPFPFHLYSWYGSKQLFFADPH